MAMRLVELALLLARAELPMSLPKRDMAKLAKISPGPNRSISF
jgi:hypothetical protein